MAHLLRTWYKTDVEAGEPEYVGAFAYGIPNDVPGTIVDVDWSERGSVQVTFLVRD
jgi:hypothetical protein